MNNTEISRERCEYASKLLKEINVPYEIKNPDIGHINLLYNNKCVMSFWARTGRFIYTVNPKGLENAKTLDADLDRGIKKCIKCYLRTFGVNDEQI